MILIPNYNVVIPVAADLFLTTQTLVRPELRLEQQATINVQGNTVNLPFEPVCQDWVELYKNGRRIINPRIKRKVGGSEFEIFNIVGSQIIFTEAQNTTYTVICDTRASHPEGSLIIPISNTQGFLSTRASLFIEPIVMEQPSNGYARLTTDRQSIAYVPDYGFIGTDSFSYCVINNHGQYSRNYCVNITVSG